MKLYSIKCIKTLSHRKLREEDEFDFQNTSFSTESIECNLIQNKNPTQKSMQEKNGSIIDYL